MESTASVEHTWCRKSYRSNALALVPVVREQVLQPLFGLLCYPVDEPRCTHPLTHSPAVVSRSKHLWHDAAPIDLLVHGRRSRSLCRHCLSRPTLPISPTLCVARGPLWMRGVPGYWPANSTQVGHWPSVHQSNTTSRT